MMNNQDEIEKFLLSYIDSIELLLLKIDYKIRHPFLEELYYGLLDDYQSFTSKNQPRINVNSVFIKSLKPVETIAEDFKKDIKLVESEFSIAYQKFLRFYSFHLISSTIIVVGLLSLAWNIFRFLIHSEHEFTAIFLISLFSCVFILFKINYDISKRISSKKQFIILISSLFLFLFSWISFDFLEYFLVLQYHPLIEYIYSPFHPNLRMNYIQEIGLMILIIVIISVIFVFIICKFSRKQEMVLTILKSRNN